MRYFLRTRAALLLSLLIVLVLSTMILLDPSVAFAVDTPTSSVAVKPLLAGLHPATLAAFQLLASLTALVALDD